jgi:outer membrane beta-barrel protein
MLPQKNMKVWGIRIAVILGAVLWLAMMATSWAEAAENTGSAGDPEYSFRWLDPEKKIYVLQNRKFTKANRATVSVMGGLGFSAPYRSVTSLEGRFSYYFHEEFGFEVFYRKSNNSENNTFQALVNTNAQVFPVVREISAEYGGLLHWVPWYAKINVFNNILYFDWYFSGGAGSMESTAITRRSGVQTGTAQNLFSVFAGTGHQYYLTQSLIFRLDVTGSFYRAPVFGTSGEQTWFSNYDFAVGLGLRI